MTYDQLLRAQYHANLLTRADLERSNELYRQALARDSRSAVAWAGLALNHALLGYFGVPAEEASNEAERAVRRALELDGALAEAHAAFGLVLHVYRWDWAGAEREYRRALELNPNDASSHHRLWALLLPLGRTEEAARALSAARRLDPLSMSIAVNLGQHLVLRDEVDAGLRELQRAIDLEPASGLPQLHLWWIHHRLGRYDEAAAALVRGLRGFGLESAAAIASTTLATHGYATALERAAEEAAAQAARTGTMAYTVAELFAAAGRPDEALTWLRRGYLDRAPEMPWIAISPLFDPLRGRAEFRELLSALGLARGGAATPGG
jgi:serine/threonine-protein kinase